MKRERVDDSIPFACGTEVTPNGRVIREGEVCLRRQLARAQAEVERLRREREEDDDKWTRYEELYVQARGQIVDLQLEIERLRRERDNWKLVAEQKTDALCDVAEERARLRTEREVLAAAVEARGRFAAHLLSCGACRPIDPCSTGKDLEDEWLVAQDEALALLAGEKGGGGE